jgi:ferredoxin-nitrite reductase
MIEENGMNGMKAHILQEYKKSFESAGELVLEKAKFSEFHELKDGTFGFCYQTDCSRLNAKEMKEVADFATEHDAEIRFGIDQNIYILGLKDPSSSLKSPTITDTILTCAGNLCPYAVWSIKDETSYLPIDKINEHQIQVGFSGCAKGCGRHRHTDIGLIGLKTNNFGDTDGGARVFLGAEHTEGKSTGRQLFSMVPFVHLNSVISLAIKLFELSEYEEFEEYSANILNNYSEEFLSLWFLANLETKKSIGLKKLEKEQSIEFEKELLKKEFPDLDFWQHVDENFHNAVSYLCKKLWTIEGEDPHYKPKVQRTNFR